MNWFIWFEEPIIYKEFTEKYHTRELNKKETGLGSVSICSGLNVQCTRSINICDYVCFIRCNNI